MCASCLWLSLALGRLTNRCRWERCDGEEILEIIHTHQIICRAVWDIIYPLHCVKYIPLFFCSAIS